MRVAILGIDGYIGWSLAVYLKSKGHEVGGIDNCVRRDMVCVVGSDTAVPIGPFEKRMESIGIEKYARADIVQNEVLPRFLRLFKPDAIVHLAEQPSAPFSMRGAKEAAYTQANNVVGNLNLLFAMRDVCPDAHLVKLGTMGEYGTPNIEISEGDIEIVYKGRIAKIPFPKLPYSFYHCSKVHDTVNIRLATELWGLAVTDIMQGPVFGVRIDEMDSDDLMTRFDYDECFGTCINRFVAQAVAGLPLTPYGEGGQIRGFIPLKDSIRCIELILENPAGNGKHEIINQFMKTFSIMELAEIVKAEADAVGIDVEIKPVENPRSEVEGHFYKPRSDKLRKLGYKQDTPVDAEIRQMIVDLIPFGGRIKKYLKDEEPEIKWKRESSE